MGQNHDFSSADAHFRNPQFYWIPDDAAQEPLSTAPQQLVARFLDKPLDFQPGEKMSYSNSGYVLLGYLIEKISGESYEKFVQENIFTSLAMKDSGYDSNFAIIPHRVEGYEAGPNGLIHAGFINMTVPFSAGALYSTTEDLQRWEQELFGGKVLSASSLKKMATPFRNNYAFGLVVHTMNGHKVIEHGGGIEGFNAVLAYYPEEKLTVIVLGNVSGSAPQEIAAKLAAVVYGEKVVLPSEHQEVKVDAKCLTGTWGDTNWLRISSDGYPRGRPFICAGDRTIEVRDYPESNPTIFEGRYAQIKLVTDEKGRATADSASKRDRTAWIAFSKVLASESPAEGQHAGRDRSQSTVHGRWMG